MGPGMLAAQDRLGTTGASQGRRKRNSALAKTQPGRGTRRYCLPGALVCAVLTAHQFRQRRVMTSPSPVPPYLRVLDASPCSKARNSLGKASGGTPMPLSLTSYSSLTAHHSRAAIRTARVTPPISVNLTALLAS
jgi:hypothetical protein